MTADGERAEGGGQREVVRAEHLSKWYGQVIGLNDITVTIGGALSGVAGASLSIARIKLDVVEFAPAGSAKATLTPRCLCRIWTAYSRVPL